MATILPKSLLLAGAAATLLLNPGFAATVADMQPAGKGKVRCAGVNSCKGQGGCASANNCKGSNNCKGQGFLRMSKPDCEAALTKLQQQEADPLSID